MIAICKNDKCPKIDLCLRFQEQFTEPNSPEMLFKYICKEENNYKWFWETDNKPVIINQENKKEESK